MSVTYDQAGLADEFHVSHDGLPCKVWTRAGITHYGPGPEQFYIPVDHDGDEGRDYWAITGVNAGDFHTAQDCPLTRSGRPEVHPGQPVLSSGYNAAGYDALGFNRDGYDYDGFNSSGFDASGYDRYGYDAGGLNREGYERGTLAADLNLADLWSYFRPSSRFLSDAAKQDEFRQRLRELACDPDSLDNLEFCSHCEEPAWDTTSTQGGQVKLCESCWDDWADCDSCDERFPPEDLTTTLSESHICESCRNNYYTFCEECDGYYPDGAEDEHDHDDPDEDEDSGCGCCSSPQPAFRVRNDGCEPLANDTRVTVMLPAGIISAEGLEAIRLYLYRMEEYDVSYDLPTIGDAWQAKAGNYTKRLSRMAYQKYQVKLTPEILSQVGCIAREHSAQASAEIEVTRELNMSAGAFCNEGSCWWNSYSESRCALKTNGGFGLRSFNEYHDVCGRAWVLPLRKDELSGRLVPTFETMTPDAFVVFNGYGDLHGYAAPRIVAHMAGWTYRKISFECHPMYVNAGGYLIAAEELAEKYTDGRLELTVSQHARLYQTEQENKEKELIHA
jgi:hypothetical protein